MNQCWVYPGRVQLKAGAAQAEVFPFGALLNEYSVCAANGVRHNVVQGYRQPHEAQLTITDGFYSAKLSPFPCRLSHGRYAFDGKTYQLDKHVLNGHAIHGLLYDVPFQVSGSGADDELAWVSLVYDYLHEHSGYPFDYRIEVRYTLSETGLTVQTALTNFGTVELPIADGWHPYFTLGGAVDNWRLQINSMTQLAFDADLLPTGETLADERFVRERSLQNIELDNSFVLASHTEAACTLSNDVWQLSIFPSEAYPYLQVYIPPTRDSIAIENLSGAPDCFNNGLGLLRLRPNENYVLQTQYVLSAK